MSRDWTRFSIFVTGRKGAWIALALAVVFVAGVISLAEKPGSGAGSSLPPDSEAAQVQSRVEDFPGTDRSPVTVVFSRDGADLNSKDLAAARRVAQNLAQVAGTDASRLIVSPDGEAAIANIPVRSDLPSAKNAALIENLRAAVGQDLPSGLTVQVTGGPAFGADITNSFDGANFLLLAVTIIIVALLLLITYRSPVLWLVPLTVVALAAELATTVDGQLAVWFDLQFDSGVVSVLVFGAGTNYALLLISRYREELRHAVDHRVALVKALRETAPAILASNATVVLALLTLVFAAVPSTFGLGVAGAVGLLFAMLFGLFVLPAALAVCGRRVFWPFIPRHGDADKSHTGVWFSIADGVRKRPVRVLSVSVILLAVFGSGLIGTQVGLSQTEQFRVHAESVEGFDTMAQHYPSRSSEPAVVVARTGHVDDVIQAVMDVDGVTAVHPDGQDPDGWTKLAVMTKFAPDTDASFDVITDLRDAVHPIAGADAMVGGPVAQTLDTRTASISDLMLIVPLVLAVAFIILLILLRSIVAPVVLSIVNMASAVASIGAGTWVGEQLFDFPALGISVPLLAFLFLVALGIDYTIFLVTRAREEAHTHGTSAGMTRAVATTGGVITSAGIVLAAVFAALGVLPLMTLAQLGLIVGLGVLIDTLLVRTVVIPALFTLIGPRIWWPSRPSHGRHDSTAKVPVASSRT